MAEEERLELVSTVEDEFTEPLQRLESALDDVDDEIRETGAGEDEIRIDVELSGVGTAIAELEALESQLDDIGDSLGDIGIDPSVGMGGGGGRGEAVTSGGIEDVRFDQEWERASLDVDLDSDAAMFEADRDTSFASTIADMEDGIPSFGGDDVDLGQGFDFDPKEQSLAEAFDLPGGWGDRSGPSNLTTIRRGMKKLGKEMSDARFTMRNFHQIVASLIPLAGVFVAALPAAIVGIGALATAAIGAAVALGGIGALGLGGMMLAETGTLDTQVLVDRFSEVFDSFVDAFAPLMGSFAPLLDDAITQLELMAGPLASASSGLLAFRDAFRGMTDFITSAIPSLVADTLAFTQAVMPTLRGIGEFLASLDVFGYLATTLNESYLALQAIGLSVVEILPAIVNLSQGFLTLSAAILGLIGVFSWLLNLSPMLTKAFGLLTGAMLVAVTISTVLTVAKITYAKSVLSTLIPALNAEIASFLGVAAASWQAYLATAAFLSLISLGVVAITGLATQFDVLGNNIAGARKELEKFTNTGTALGGSPTVGVGGGVGQSSGVYQDNSTTIIDASSRDDAARQQYSSAYERKQYRDSVFGN